MLAETIRINAEEGQCKTFDQIFTSFLFNWSEELESEARGMHEEFSKKRPAEERSKYYPRYHYQDRYSLKYPSHAESVPYATKFLLNITPEGENPVDFIRESTKLGGRLLPDSRTSTLISPRYSKMGKEEREAVFRARFRDGFGIREVLGKYSREIVLETAAYERLLGQFFSAALEASHIRGFRKPLVIPAFDGQRDYFPEGLMHGTLVIKGPLRDLCGKHSGNQSQEQVSDEERPKIVCASAGEEFGDCAAGVDFYVKGDVDSITQTMDCRFFIGGRVNNRQGLDRLISDCRTQIFEGKEGKAEYDRVVASLDKY